VTLGSVQGLTFIIKAVLIPFLSSFRFSSTASISYPTTPPTDQLILKKASTFYTFTRRTHFPSIPYALATTIGSKMAFHIVTKKCVCAKNSNMSDATIKDCNMGCSQLRLDLHSSTKCVLSSWIGLDRHYYVRCLSIILLAGQIYSFCIVIRRDA
jgi:hypothetical protein